MSRNKKALILLLLVAVNVALSLACGGGGGGTVSASPSLSPSLSPSTSPSLSPSPSPSPSPSVSPSPTPTPSPNFSIGDFEGTWHFEPAPKIDMQIGMYGLWFNVLSDGSIEPEPEELGFIPRVAGGSITLDDAVTGEFSGVITLDSGEGPESFSFTGTLSSDHTQMDVHFVDDNIDGVINRTPGREKAVGMYSVLAKAPLLPEDINHFFMAIAVLGLNADGSYTEVGGEEDPGTWSIFRDQFVVLQNDWDEDGDDEPETHFSAFAMLDEGAPAGQPDIFGHFMISSSSGTTEGDLRGLSLPADTPHFDLSMLGGTWNIVFQDEEDSLPEGVIGLLINDDGTVPDQTVGEVQVIGSVTDFDETTGAFSMSLTVEDEDGSENHVYRGFVSPFGNRAYVTEYTIVNGDEVETGEMRMFRAGAFDGPDLDGYWSLGTTPALGSDTMKVLNFRLQDGYLYADSAMLSDPVGVAFLTDDNEIAFFLDFDIDDDNSITTFVYGVSDGTATAFTDMATILLEDEGDVIYYRGYFGKFDPSETADGALGNYIGTFHLLGGNTNIVAIVAGEGSESRIVMTVEGVSYDVVWDDRNLLLFHLHDPLFGYGDYANGERFFFIPYSLASRLGEEGFASPAAEVWANK